MTLEEDSDITVTTSIDSGLYGKVYKGRQNRLLRDVAIKIIKPEWCDATNAEAHARAISRLPTHPNIVIIFEVRTVYIPDINTHSQAIIMEWVDGPSLAKRLAGDPLPPKTAKQLCKDILSGVEHLHQNNAAHGDLHLGNIVLTKDDCAKIIDIKVDSPSSLKLTSAHHEVAAKLDIASCQTCLHSIIRRSTLDLSVKAELSAQIHAASTISELWSAISSYNEDRNTTPLSSNSGNEPQELGHATIQHGDQRSLAIGLFRDLKTKLLSEAFTTHGPTCTSARLQERIQEIEKACSPVLPTLAKSAFQSDRSDFQPWAECIEDIANLHGDSRSWSGHTPLLALRNYPAIILMYTAGMAAFWAENFDVLYNLLLDCQYRCLGPTHRLSSELHQWKAENRELWNFAMNKEYITPISNRLSQITQDALREVPVLETQFEMRYHLFEYFLLFRSEVD